MAQGNILGTYYHYVREYFTYRFTRKVFFYALILLIVSAVINSIIDSTFTSQFFLAMCAFVAFVTLVDSIIARIEFTDKLGDLADGKGQRLADRDINLEFGTGNGVFTESERMYIKKKKREFTYIIAIKLVFFIFFVVFLFGWM